MGHEVKGQDFVEWADTVRFQFANATTSRKTKKILEVDPYGTAYVREGNEIVFKGDWTFAIKKYNALG